MNTMSSTFKTTQNDSLKELKRAMNENNLLGWNDPSDEEGKPHKTLIQMPNMRMWNIVPMPNESRTVENQ
jgi:hypothetical protein